MRLEGGSQSSRLFLSAVYEFWSATAVQPAQLPILLRKTLFSWRDHDGHRFDDKFESACQLVLILKQHLTCLHIVRDAPDGRKCICQRLFLEVGGVFSDENN